MDTARVGRVGDRTLRLWDLESGRTLRTLAGHRDPVNAVAVIPDCHACSLSLTDRTLRVWDLESGRVVRTLEAHSGRSTPWR